MSDDLNKKIQQISEFLGQENAAENIKSLMSMLGSGMGGNNGSQASEPSPNLTESSPAREEKKEERTSKNDFEDTAVMLRKMAQIVERVKSNNDPRINLLTSIKPFLNTKRQQNINNCIRLLHMSSLNKYIGDGLK